MHIICGIFFTACEVILRVSHIYTLLKNFLKDLKVDNECCGSSFFFMYFEINNNITYIACENGENK